MKAKQFQRQTKQASDLRGAVVMNTTGQRREFFVIEAPAFEEWKALFDVLRVQTVNIDEVTDGKEAEDVIFESGLKQAFHLPFENIGFETLFHISGRCALFGEALISKAVECLTVKQEADGVNLFATFDGFVMTAKDFATLQTFHFACLWPPEELNGYEPRTTIWLDLCTAEAEGVDAVRDLFDRAFNEWRDKYKELTELVLALNHKCWSFYTTAQRMDQQDEKFVNLTREQALQFYELYLGLFDKANDFALDNLKGDEFSYFWNITD